MIGFFSWLHPLGWKRLIQLGARIGQLYRLLQATNFVGLRGKYRGREEPIHLVGVEFSRVARNLVGVEVETLGVIQYHCSVSHSPSFCKG